MTFEEWWDTQWNVPFPMTTEFLKSVYEAGYEAGLGTSYNGWVSGRPRGGAGSTGISNRKETK